MISKALFKGPLANFVLETVLFFSLMPYLNTDKALLLLPLCVKFFHCGFNLHFLDFQCN